MKRLLKKIVQRQLRWFAQRILSKYKPKIVAITGSFGKTSTRQAIVAVLKPYFTVGTNIKNENNEIGIPATIIGRPGPGRSVAGWIGLYLAAIKWLLGSSKHYPEVLVLEMGADHPGDIQYFTEFVPIDIGVLTGVGPVHLEFYKSIDHIAREKGKLIKAVSKDGFVVINGDDERVVEQAQKVKASVLSYGMSKSVDIQASSIGLTKGNGHRHDAYGITFKVNYQGTAMPAFLPHVAGNHLTLAGLAAIGVGLAFDMNLHAIIEGLKHLEPPKGRMRFIDGIKNTLLIDDTYNSSPDASRQALKQLASIDPENGGKRYAILGDMLELGEYTSAAHREIGDLVSELSIDYLITVGPLSAATAKAATVSGMDNDSVFHFDTSEEAGRFLQDRIGSGDVLLVKGSQGVRMEKIVKELMAEPQRATELLVRQYKPWV